MPPALVAYILEYGYTTIFILVFAQELGIPNPIPNELILIFSGYLASVGQLDFFWIIMTAVLADFIGTLTLYLIFYSFGDKVMRRVKKWLPQKRINRLINYISKKGRWGIYIGRLMPLVRGYTSVAAGLLRLPPREFIPVILLSAFTWSGGYVILGYILGPQWDKLTEYFGLQYSLLVLAGVIVLYAILSKAVPAIRRSLKP